MNEVDHIIQKHIMSYLTLTESARFAQMRPPGVDSNLYAYHLTKLLKMGFINKNEREYRLSTKGLIYVDRLSFDKTILSNQPKINTGILLKNEFNEILLTKRLRQPLLGFWGLPMGKLHNDDTDIYVAAERELREKTGIIIRRLEHAGDCYLRLVDGDDLISASFAHIFYKKVAKDALFLDENSRWVGLNELDDADIISSVKEMARLTLGRSDRFFAEISFDDQVLYNTKED
ncbi:hypothetical protein FACS189431_3740 [Alphaproteobacteria bacterium]|nr:hypothetical protein FACS189431_3740 [Alphaproteobacteria bacterium]